MKQLLFIAFFVFYNMAMQAQQHEVIATAGDYFKNSNGALSWTIGEVITETLSGSNVSLNQGFQQTNVVVTEIQKPILNNFEIDVFPNPTNDYLNIKSSKEQTLKYQLVDMNGKIIEQNIIENKSYKISLKYLLKGIYFINFIENNIEVKTFKIIKN